MSAIEDIQIPEFSEFKLIPNNPLCIAIDSSRLLVEVLGGLKPAENELGESELASKIVLDGNYAILVRYRREKDNKYYPACILSFDETENGEILVNQIQGTKNRHVAFRFHSSFNEIAFYLKLIEESFLKRGIYVSVGKTPVLVE